MPGLVPRLVARSTSFTQLCAARCSLLGAVKSRWREETASATHQAGPRLRGCSLNAGHARCLRAACGIHGSSPPLPMMSTIMNCQRASLLAKGGALPPRMRSAWVLKRAFRPARPSAAPAAVRCCSSSQEKPFTITTPLYYVNAGGR